MVSAILLFGVMEFAFSWLWVFGELAVTGGMVVIMEEVVEVLA